MSEKKIAGLIVAAGMSSRMKDFKPLLPLNGQTLIENTITHMYAGGAQELVVVIGKRADELRPILKRLRVTPIYNQDYQTTDMFTSVKMGLTYLQDRCEALFFNPGDVPLFLPQTLREMKKALQQPEINFVRPAYCGKGGHPFLMDQSCIQGILDYSGHDGLRGAMQRFSDSKLSLDVPDKGILIDADTPDDYQEMLSYLTVRGIPDAKNCREICRWFNTPQRAIEHGVAVAEKAEEIRLRLEQSGYHLDQRLVQAGAMLHDVAKGHGHRQHAEVGAAWLQEWGYLPTAWVVAAHTDLPPEALEKIDERSIVHLADKYVKGNKRVTLEERFSEAWERWRDDEIVYNLVKQRFAIAKQLQQNIDDICQ